MFTGIIEELGIVSDMNKTKSSTRIVITINKVAEKLKTGDSLAVNGICLTVTHHSSGSCEADISSETLEKSTLGLLKPGDPVNLERAVNAGEPLGGHFVTGHIDGTGKVLTVTKKGNSHLIKISSQRKLMKYIASKGSVAIDGISLTPFNCTEVTFDVAVIPHTYTNTTLKDKKPNSLVNIECDILSKYIDRLLEFKKLALEEKDESKIDTEYLKRTGFLY
ncbi:MAG: riboflavin synthase [Spirochaetales bacterium]|nr:riboflavin synthase [Spirochaetales bacterium]